MSFKPNSLYYSDGYKVGHKRMLAPNTSKLYGTWIPRSLKYAPEGVKKIVSFGQQLVVKWLHDEYVENFFSIPLESAMLFIKDMSLYLGMEYEGEHFKALHELGYLPIRIKSLSEGIETLPGIPHMTFINTVDGFAWLTLYLETIISSLAWKPSTSATIALQYRRNLKEWIEKTDPSNMWLIDYLAHDFSARGLSPWDMLSSGLGHATSFRGSDTLIVIPAARYFYGESYNEVCINSVNASEHSVSTTCIFTMGEKEMISYYMKQFPKGILSIVADTFDLWKLITEYLPQLKDEIFKRDGKLVIRPDSGYIVDIICGKQIYIPNEYETKKEKNDTIQELNSPQYKGVIELLWDIFGGTINEKGYKVLDSHIGAIYGDSVTLERQVEIYKRLEARGFACTNIVLGVGSYTYQMTSRDTLGWAAKGSWFETKTPQGYKGEQDKVENFDIYKDPITDDGTKKSLKGMLQMYEDEKGVICVKQQVSEKDETKGILQVIYENGKFYNLTTLTEIRKRLN